MHTLASPENFEAIARRDKDDAHGVIVDVTKALHGEGFALDTIRTTAKPWGLEVQVDPAEAHEWIFRFFYHHELPSAALRRPQGPNLMCLAPGKRLSWHVHERKDAHLHVVTGPVSVATSETDVEPEPTIVQERSYLYVPHDIRHRLGGLSTWGVVAEISTHAFPEHPTDESDTRRISDDFGRES